MPTTATSRSSIPRRTVRARGARCNRAATVRRLRPTVSDTPRKSTFSIVAADLEAGEVGCAVQSKYFSVGSVVPWVRAGVGAVATQAAGVAVYGRAGARGARPWRRRRRTRSTRVLADDPGRETRQLGSSRPTGARRRSPGRSAWTGRGNASGRASPCRGTSSPARPWSTRWRTRTEDDRHAGRTARRGARSGPSRGRRQTRPAIGGVDRRTRRRPRRIPRGHRPHLRSARRGSRAADRRAATADRDLDRAGTRTPRERALRAG